MPSPLILPTLTQALRALGNAHVYYSSHPLSGAVGGWQPLGQKEGAISVAFNETVSELTAPELTGPAVHEVTVLGARPVVTFSLIAGDEALWPILSPTGSAHGGSDFPQATVKYALAVIPDAEIGGGLSYDGTSVWTRVAGNGITGGTGAGVIPKNAIWFWKGILRRAEAIPYTIDNGGKSVTNITFESLYDVTKIAGHRLWTIGNPLTGGATFWL